MMTNNRISPLNSLKEYSYFISESVKDVEIIISTIRVWSTSPFTGIAEGEIIFKNGLRLRMREEIDFDAGIIMSYGYEVYRGSERLFWYDDFPHPKDPYLAVTMPHHKHIPPDIKHHRIPAPNISFIRPNLSILIKEIKEHSKEKIKL